MRQKTRHFTLEFKQKAVIKVVKMAPTIPLPGFRNMMVGSPFILVADIPKRPTANSILENTCKKPYAGVCKSK